MFNVSKSGYYNWSVRGPSKRWYENEDISLAIRDIFKDSFGGLWGAQDQSGTAEKRASCLQA